MGVMLCMNDGILNKFSFISCLKQLRDRTELVAGKRVHACILSSELNNDVAVATTLLCMYGHCGCMDKAFHLFEQMKERNVVTWNAMIALSVRHGYGGHAQQLFQQMLLEGFVASAATFVSTLQAAFMLNDGLQLHVRIIANGLDADLITSNTLLSMYHKLGRVEEVHKVFNGMPHHSLVSWTILITCCLQQGDWFLTLQTFQDMQDSGAIPNSFTFVSLLSSCADGRALAEGKWVHQNLVCHSLMPDIIIRNALLRLYSQCGSLEDACYLFEAMDEGDVISWTTIIAAHSQHNLVLEARQLFRSMQVRGIFADARAFVSTLNTIATPEAIAEGKQIHVYVLSTGLEHDPCVGAALLNMYGNCGLVETAWSTFERMPYRSLVAWNTMMAVLTDQGEPTKVLELFYQMQEEGLFPDKSSFVCMLDFCTTQLSISEGNRIQTRIFSSGFGTESTLRTGLLFMYGKDGNLEKARSVFHPSFEHDTPTWNAMIGVLSQHGKGEDAIQVFYQMQLYGAFPDKITFMSILLACGHSGLVDVGWKFFYLMDAVWGIQPDVEHLNCMVDLLGRAGCLEEAANLIERMHSCANATTWTALSVGYKLHRCIGGSVNAARMALKLEPMDAGMYILMSSMCIF